MHGSVSHAWGDIGPEVDVDEVFPLVLQGDGISEETRLSFLFDVVWDEETSDGSFDFVESCSTSLEHQVLVWMATLSDYMLE